MQSSPFFRLYTALTVIVLVAGFVFVQNNYSVKKSPADLKFNPADSTSSAFGFGKNFFCTLDSVAFDKTTVIEGEIVSITVQATGCPDGEIVLLQLLENDGPNGSKQAALEGLESIALKNGAGSTDWTAVWAIDEGDPAEWIVQSQSDYFDQFDPEFIVKASLRSFPNQTAVTKNNLSVQSRFKKLAIE